MSYLSNLLDSIIANTDNIIGFTGEAYCKDEQAWYSCTLSLSLNDEDEHDMAEISYQSEDGSIPQTGLHLFLRSSEEGIVDAYNYQYEYTESQITCLTELLQSSKDYRYFQDAANWYSKENALKRINELVLDGQIDWDEPEYDMLSAEETGLDYDTDFYTYTAEYGDVVFTFSVLDDEDALEELESEADEDDDPGAYWDYLSYTPTIVISVGDYYKNTIHNLSDEQVEYIFGENNSDDDNILDIKDLIVKTNIAACITKGHELTKINANVYALNCKTFQRELRTTRAFYCDTCKRYYMLESDYNKLCEGYILCCQVVDAKDLVSGNYDNWAKTSVLMNYGYSVSKKANLSDTERHMILDMVIYSGAWSKSRCIDFIEWQISSKSGFQNMDNAVAKWNNDINYLKSGKKTIPRDIMVKRIKNYS